MNELNEIPKNVLEMIERSAKWIGRLEEESFSAGAFTELAESEHVQSPIEMILQVALQTVAQINGIDMTEPIETDVWSTGLDICPQFRIGRYRADFAVFYKRFRGQDSQLVVECDGTAFHERTEAERRREKARDRFMQKEGWKVFRYTGKEIMSEPYKVAAEILSHLANDSDIVTPEEYFS